MTSAFDDIGADEVLLYCCARDHHQIDRLANATALTHRAGGFRPPGAGRG
jgi:hypothetical protein